MIEVGNVNPFEVLAQSLQRIEEQLATLAGNLGEKNNSMVSPMHEVLSVSEAATFLVLSKQSVYRHIRKIPHYKRNGRLYFKRVELVEYIEGGKFSSPKDKHQLNRYK